MVTGILIFAGICMALVGVQFSCYLSHQKREATKESAAPRATLCSEI